MLGDRYASAIAQGKVGGLFKLLSSNAVDANRAIINTPGDFRYYSMFRRTHEYGFGNEIALERGNVKTGFAGLDYGFFLALGEVDIDRFVDLSTATPTWLDNKLTPAWKFFVDHTPPSITAEVRAQQRKSRRMLIENVAFGDAAAVIDGNVLLLRSVQYNDSDTLSALRIERSVEDGSVILAWKLLKKYPVPLAAGPEPSEP
jgi:hypothetical protein